MVSCIVIDDDQNIVDLFCELLDIMHVDVLAKGYDGQDAVNLYEKHKPDLVFTDLQMPAYDGLYAVESIKDKNPDAKIIMVTGDANAEESIIIDSLNVPVIRKPFDIHTIKQTITDVFLDESGKQFPFEIQYKFKDDDSVYSCVVTFEQYKNLKILPIIQECKILGNSKSDFKSYTEKMQKALDLACKNDLTHIRMLSEIVG
ncbi:MAG: response regulator [Candidatus Nitrosopumilus sp. bin_68KS]